MRRAIVAFLALLAATFQASAQSILSDEQVAEHIRFALLQLENARCDGEEKCAPATPEELVNPPISKGEGRLVINRAVLTAVAGHCGIDGAVRSYLPMMATFRERGGKDERTMAVVAILHGIVQGYIERELQSGPPCTEALRQRTEAILPPP